jgi:hypothetical protein
MRDLSMCSLITYICVLALVSPAAAQQNTPAAPATIYQGNVALPNSIDRLKATKESVLVIPDGEIFQGANLSEAQKAALTANLKSANFKAIESGTLNPKDLAAQRLPNGQLFQVMQANFAPTMMQQNPAVGMFTLDPCATPDHTNEQLAALQRVLVAQLKVQGGDVDGFVVNVPKECSRKQLIYYVKSAVVIAK